MKKAVISPIRRGSLYKTKAQTVGCLLFGNTGCGKTLLAHSVLGECKGWANILVVQSSDWMSKWAGDSQKFIDNTFAFASNIGPSIIYLEEAEHLFQERLGSKDKSESLEGIQNSLLQNFDLLRKGNRRTFFICCSNFPDAMDPSFLRRLQVKLRDNTSDDIYFTRLGC